MQTENLKTPRTPQGDAPSTQALTPNEGVKPNNPGTLQMTRAEWKATPRDYKIFSRKTGRFVMRSSPAGVSLFPVQIID